MSLATSTPWEAASALLLPALDEATLAERLEQQGYLHVPGIVSAATVRRIGTLMSSEFARLAEDFYRHTGARLEDAAELADFLARQGDLDSWFLAQPRDTQHLMRGEYPLEVRQRDELRLLAGEVALTGLLRRLIDSPTLRLHFPPMLRFKVPGVSRSEVPLHQDGPYFPHIHEFATVWIPFCPIDEACGGVNVLEGSHQLGPLRHSQAALWGNFVDAEAGHARFTKRHIEMEPGDALIFGPHLLHYSHPNTSDRVRYSVDSRWFGANTPSSRQYYDVERAELVRAF
jgi:hypothetical protein